MAQLYAPSRYVAVDGDGHPYAGAKLYFYQTGTSTLQTVYADSAATTPLSNPVVADANGLFAAIYLAGSNRYKAVLKDANEVTIWTTDPIDAATPSASFTPQGRLTLASGSPVMTSNQTSATTIYYTPYVGNQIPIYDGTQFSSLTFAELSNLTAQSSTGNAGPAAVTTNSNYDLFVWSNGGVATLTRGPAWTSDTARGSGAGTTELTRANGVWLNARDITNGPTASRGTYVGTVRSDGSSQINWQVGAVAAGGTAAILGVWNAYNRISVAGLIGDNTNTWNYAGGTWRPANSAQTMRASFLQGQAEDAFGAVYQILAVASGGNAAVGIGYNNITAVAGQIGIFAGGGTTNLPISGNHRIQALGYNFMQAMEINASVTATFTGDAGSTDQIGGLTYEGRF